MTTFNPKPRRAIASAASALALLLAGPALAQDTGQEEDDSLEYQIEEQVCIGNRALYVIRIGMGGAL